MIQPRFIRHSTRSCIEYPPEVLKTLRNLLREVAFNEHGSTERLFDYMARIADDNFIEHLRKQGGTTSLLASFGIHRCSGCGGDPVWLKETYGYDCKGCEGMCWMHEEKADPGHYHTDPTFAGWGFTVRWAIGMFGPSRTEPGWHAKWKLKKW